MFKRRAAIDLKAISYKASPEAITDVVAGRVSLMFADMTPDLPLMRSGQLRALATTTKERSKLLADLPSIQEQGFDLGDISAWTGLLAPKGAPPEIIAQLSELLRERARSPRAPRRVDFESQGSAPKEFAQQISTDIALWAATTKEAGIERQ